MSREERRLGQRERFYRRALDLLFLPWLMALSVLPLLYLYPHLAPLWFRPPTVVQRQDQSLGLLPDQRHYFAVELLEPQRGRVQILVNGEVVARFDGVNVVEVVASPGALLMLDSRTELRLVRLKITSSTAGYPATGQEYELRQEIRALLVQHDLDKSTGNRG